MHRIPAPTGPSSPAPLRSRSLVLWAALALVSGCGGPVMGGSGELLVTPGTPDLVVLQGTPKEMGWHQGRLLRDRIRGLHQAWQDRVFSDAVGGAADTHAGAAGDLRETCAWFVDQIRSRLPERARLELEGMAAGCGLSEDDLLLTEAMQDCLRIMVKTQAPRRGGVVAAVPDGPEGRAWFTGPDAEILADHWIVVHRKPTAGDESVVVAWPGSLGGVAGIGARGAGFLCAEVDVQPAARGFGSGVPFHVAARLALETTAQEDAYRAEIKGTAGHALLTFGRVPGNDGAMTVVGSIEAFVDVELPIVLEQQPIVALGPFVDLGGREALAWREALEAPGLSAAERWARARRAADANDGLQGPWVEVRWTGTVGALALHPAGAGAERRVPLASPVAE